MLANVNSTKIHVVLVQHEQECALCEDANTRRRNVSGGELFTGNYIL